MPIRDFIIPELSTNIAMPVVSQVVDGLLQQIQLQKYFLDNESIYYHSDYQAASSSVDTSDRANISRSRCDVTYEFVLNPNNVRWPEALTFHHLPAYGMYPKSKHDEIPMFSDGTADVRVVEQVVPCSLKLDFSLKFKERELAERAFVALNNITHQQGVHRVHDLSYSYPLSLDMCTAFYEIYMRRSEYYDFAAKQPIKSWRQYMSDHTGRDVGYTIHRDDAASDNPERQVVVKRILLGALGLLEIDQAKPEPMSEDRYTDRYEITFTYHIQFGRPDVLRMYLPVVVESRLLPHYLVGYSEATTALGVTGLFQTRGWNSYLKQTGDPPRMLWRLPYYDDFNLPPCQIINQSMRPFVIAAYLPDVGTFTDIGLLDFDITFHPIVVELLKLHGPDLFGATGLFNVTVTSNDDLIDPSTLTVDPDTLVVRIPFTDRTKRYHLTLSEATDIRYVDPKWWKYLIKYSWFFTLLIVRNFDWLLNAGVLKMVYPSDLLSILKRCIETGVIDTHLATLIAGGHATADVYQYTITPEQLLQYLLQHLSPVSRRSLFAEMVDIGHAAGCLSSSIDVTALPVNGSYAFHPKVTYAYNFPFRVLTGNILVSR